MKLRTFIEQDITNQSATTDKNPKYKKSRRRFRKNLLAMDYEKGLKEASGEYELKEEMKQVKSNAKIFPTTKLKLKEWMEEGIQDKGIFKCLFLAGIPGSGKTKISQMILSGPIGWRRVDPDKIYEYIAKQKKTGMTKFSREIFASSRDKVWEQQELYVKSKLPIVIDRTGADASIIEDIKEDLEKLGYETGMLFVKIDVNTAVKRISGRERKITKKDIENEFVPYVEGNYSYYKELFGNRFWELDNSLPIEQSKDSINKISKEINKWALQPVREAK